MLYKPHILEKLFDTLQTHSGTALTNPAPAALMKQLQKKKEKNLQKDAKKSKQEGWGRMSVRTSVEDDIIVWIKDYWGHFPLFQDKLITRSHQQKLIM